MARAPIDMNRTQLRIKLDHGNDVPKIERLGL